MVAVAAAGLAVAVFQPAALHRLVVAVVVLVAVTATRLAGVAQLIHRTPFRDLSAEDYEQRARERELANLRKRAAKLGLTLVESPA